jgi:hypothetical protein
LKQRKGFCIRRGYGSPFPASRRIALTLPSTIFVKSDTQGYEAEVLAGLAGAADRVIGLQLELSLVPIYQGQPDYLSVLNRVNELGFTPHLIIPGYFSRQHGQMIEFDVVCFRAGND